MTQRLTKKRQGISGRRPKTSAPEQDTRAAVLKAARTVFALRGFEGTSMREVAEVAGVNNAMIYYHFKDKNELYRAVLARSFAEFDRIWDQPVFESSSATSRKKIGAYVEGFIRFQQVNEEIRRIMSMEFSSCSGNYKWLAENHFSQGYDRLAGLLQEAMRTGELKRMDLSLAVPCLIGMIVHSFTVRPIAEHIIGKKLDLGAARFGKFVTGMFFEGLGAAGWQHRTVRTKA
jgi:TetR/AcrR family transcriptional regulator